MFTKTPNSVNEAVAEAAGDRAAASPAIPFPARWDQRGLELLVRAN